MLKKCLFLCLLCTASVHADTVNYNTIKRSGAANTPTTNTTTTTTTTTTAPPTDQTPDQSQPQDASMPGGYNDIAISDVGVQAAVKFAVAQMQQGFLVKITAAQVQVVAGKNYALDLILSQNGLNYMYHVVVFVPLPSSGQEMQLTDVEAQGQAPDSALQPQQVPAVTLP